MEVVRGPISIAEILRDRNNWRRYLAWKGDEIDDWTRRVVARTLDCRTAALGCHLYECKDCGIVRLVPHSCKTSFCSSCATARTDAWCCELLSDMLDVEYRHLVFTLPQELRHLIRVNKKVLLDALYRAGARAVLSLTAGAPPPRPGKNRRRMARKRRRLLPGMMIVCHTFGSDLGFNPHLHVLVTAGGLSLDQHRWLESPPRSFLRIQDLVREWKKNVIDSIREAEQLGSLVHPPFRGDPDNPTKVEFLLICVAKKRWWIHIGPSLEEVDHAVRYCCRYTRRPVIGEMRILRYDGKDVDFLYTDYRDGEKKKVMRRSVLYFIHRLVQHIPPKRFIQVRHYGLFATARKGKFLPIARKLLGQSKRRKPRPSTWESRRKQLESEPLACPLCGNTMTLYGTLFGSPEVIAMIANIEPNARLPPRCYVPRSRVWRHSRVG
jgi:hypothetical protein